MKQTWFKKSIIILGMLVVFVAVMLVLTHSAKNGRETTKYVPKISDSPIYVECAPNEKLEAHITMKEDMSISGLRVFLVNLSAESRGSLFVTMKDGAQNILLEQTLPVNTIAPGEWFTVSGEAQLINGETYTVTFLPDDSEPFFMQISKEMSEDLPFEERVFVNGEESLFNISMGVNKVTPVDMTFGEIFYYSVPFSVIALITGILWTIFGTDKLVGCIRRIPIKEIGYRNGTDIFLCLIFE